MSRFPKDFLWGAATSSYQIEGAVGKDGRSPSIWDTFCKIPGRVYEGHSGAVACDHYHKLPEDIELIKNLGLQAYRFSVAWPRILPNGTGTVNERGLDFYESLVDQLLQIGVKPFLTLYHWDLPQVLEDKGGWRSRETAKAFAELSEAVAKRLGDRVASWATFNEPFCISVLGHEVGVHAPGLREGKKTVNTVYHHILLAHGLGRDAIKAILPSAEVGFVQSIHPQEPVFQDEQNIELARASFHRHNGWIFDPIYKGEYPKYLWDEAAEKDELPPVQDGDLDLIKGELDFLGFNTYSSNFVSHPLHGDLQTKKHYPKTQMDWDINPDCLYWTARFLNDHYKPSDIYVTESGCAWPDSMDESGRVVDLARITYFRQHLRGLSRAIEEGVPVKGYFAWSLMDNFEWAFGYEKRFGLIHVNFQTLERTPKLSAHWYKEVIERNDCG